MLYVNSKIVAHFILSRNQNIRLISPQTGVLFFVTPSGEADRLSPARRSVRASFAVHARCLIRSGTPVTAFTSPPPFTVTVGSPRFCERANIT